MSERTEPKLEVHDAVVEYVRHGLSPIRAVAGVSLDLAQGQILGIVGESGCGKSSLARAMVGLLPLARGEIRLDGEPVGALTRSARPRRERRIQMVFQDPYSSLNPRRTVGVQMEDGLKLLGMGDRSSRRDRVGEMLEEVGLARDDANGFPHQFSGGQRQRIAIARALAADPTVLIADEPTSALDASAQAQVVRLLAGLVRERGLSLVFISHDLGVVRAIAHRVAVMYLGRIVEVAPAAELWRRPLHPYSEALIRAVPEPDGRRQLPSAIGGEVPDPGRPPTGCHFRPRCPMAFDACLRDPALRRAQIGRDVACWLHTAEKEATAGTVKSDP